MLRAKIINFLFQYFGQLLYCNVGHSNNYSSREKRKHTHINKYLIRKF